MVIFFQTLQPAVLDRAFNYFFQMYKIGGLLDGIECTMLYGGLHQLAIVLVGHQDDRSLRPVF